MCPNHFYSTCSKRPNFSALNRKTYIELTRSRSRVRQAHPIPFCRLGKRIAFRRESLENWISQLESDKAVTR